MPPKINIVLAEDNRTAQRNDAIGDPAKHIDNCKTASTGQSPEDKTEVEYSKMKQSEDRHNLEQSKMEPSITDRSKTEKIKTEKSKTEKSKTEQDKDKQSDSPGSDGASEITSAGALTKTDDEERGSACKTLSAYINGMGCGFFSFAILLTVLAYGRWVTLLMR